MNYYIIHVYDIGCELKGEGRGLDPLLNFQLPCVLRRLCPLSPGFWPQV